MSATVEVIAIGARTPVGLNAETSTAAVRAGISNHDEFAFISATGEPLIVAADSQLESAMEGRDRIVTLVNSVVEEVMQKYAQIANYSGKYHILLALPEERPGFSEQDAQRVVDATRFGLETKGVKVQVDIARRGHAGSIQAVEQAVQQCLQHADELFLVIGADSYIHTETFIWLERNLQFAQPGVRSGFIPGEAAGCLVIASSKLRTTLGLPTLAIVGGIGVAQETLLRNSETGSFGVGMSEAVIAATRGLQLPRDAVDTLYIDINGERYRSEEWGFVAMRTPLLWKSLDYQAPSDCWGDVGAAFGTLAGVLAVQSYLGDYAEGQRAIVMAGSPSGLRGAMLLQDPKIADG